MKKVVRSDCVEEVVPFPFSNPSVEITEDLLRQFLYTAWWTIEDDDDHVILMDYDGFVEFYDEHVPQWREEEDGDMFFDNYSALEYLRDHVGTTVEVVREVN